MDRNLITVYKDHWKMFYQYLKVKLCISLLSLTFVIFGQHAQLSDEFNSPCNLSEWLNITNVEGWLTPAGQPAEHLEEFNISDSYPGQLYMMPWTSSWYANWRGVLLFKEVSGDFIITTNITVTQRDGDALPPASNYSLAGLMVRTPTGVYNPVNGGPSGVQNYVFAAMGRATSSSQFQLEIKTTTNGSSQLNIQNIGAGNNDILMRMVRKDNAILVLSSEDNINWTLRRRYNRGDLPETVQLGFVTYTDWNNVNAVGWQAQNNNILNDDYEDRNWNPDLIGRFDFARYEDVNLPPEYEAADFINDVSDAEILTLFGHPSEPIYPSGSKIWNGRTSSDWSIESNWNGGLPGANDYVVIPNCSCTEVHAPTLTSNSPLFAGFHLEKGANLSIAIGATLNIDLQNQNAAFVNEGTLTNEGIIQIRNAAGKSVTTIHELNNQSGGQIIINN